jgi:integrin alpha FG-GAP repeat containing protein 1
MTRLPRICGTARVLHVFAEALLVAAAAVSAQSLTERKLSSMPTLAGLRSSLLPRALLQDHSASVHLGDGIGSAIALGDFTGDRYTDLIMCDDAREMRSIHIRKWVQQRSRFEAVAQAWNATSFLAGFSLADVRDLPQSAFIANAAPLDANADGSLDLLLSVQIQDGKYLGIVLYGNGQGGLRRGDILPDVNPGMLVVDGDGDLVPDIMLTFASGQLAFYRNSPPGYFNLIHWNPFQDGEAMEPDTWSGGGNRSAMHGYAECIPDYVYNSNAFVDLNGDCMADLVVSTRNCGLHVWLNERSPLYSSSPSWPQVDLSGAIAFWNLSFTQHAFRFVPLSKDVWDRERGDGRVVFADFNGDGTMDIAHSNNDHRQLRISLNEQPSRKFGQLCTDPQDWRMHSYVALSNIVVADTGLGPAIARAGIHVGDYNYDGLGDILTINGETGTLELFEAVRGEALDVRYNLQQPKSLAFLPFQHPWFGQHTTKVRKVEFIRVADDALFGLEDPVAASFLDVDESGSQDLLVVQNHGTRLIANNYKALGGFEFFKATGVNSRAASSNPKAPAKQPYVPVVGNTVKISYDGRNGLEHGVCSQCPQASFLQLQPCSCLFGIRNIANYVKEMAIGGGGDVHSWSGLMPNAIAIMWRVEGSRRRWRVAYFTRRRGDQMLAVVLVLTTTLVLLGIAIVYLYTVEKDDEKKSQIPLHDFAS